MKTKRTIIRDFDAVYQAKLWLEDTNNDDSLEITNAMKGILRLTYLTTSQLTFFYAEIFDGIFLLDWGPDEIANILGLPANAALPITIYSPETEIDKLKKQIEGKKVSSKFAFCGHDEKSSLNNWLFGEVEVESDYRKDEKEFETWYEEKSAQWLEAIENGRVTLVDWTMEKEFDLDTVVKEHIKKMKKLPPDIVETINEVLNMSDVSDSQDLDMNNVAPRNRNNIRIHRNKIVDNRAAVLAYIDNLETHDQTKFLVFWWWNNLYTKAIANKYDASYITFYPNVNLEKFMKNHNHDPHFEKNMKELFSTLELEAPKLSRFKNLKQNLNNSPKGNKMLLINGRILKDVMQLTSHSFSQVKINIDSLFKEEKELSGAKIYDISYIISSFLDRSNTYRASLRSAKIKFMVIGIPSIFVIFYESGFLLTHSIFKIIWIVSIVTLAIPWKELNDMMRLRKSNLSATITEVGE